MRAITTIIMTLFSGFEREREAYAYKLMEDGCDYLAEKYAVDILVSTIYAQDAGRADEEDVLTRLVPINVKWLKN